MGTAALRPLSLCVYGDAVGSSDGHDSAMSRTLSRSIGSVSS